MSRLHPTILLPVKLALLVATVSFPVAIQGAKSPFFEGKQIEFSLTDLDGREVSSSDPRFEGRVLLIDLWATYCPPCLTEIPTFIDLHERLGDRGLVVVGIAFEAEEDPQERRGQASPIRGTTRDQLPDPGRWHLVRPSGCTAGPEGRSGHAGRDPRRP